MSFQQGLSGLNAASKSLEVLGNNVANASTVGFKQSQTQFSDVYANSLTGSGASQVGIGVKIAKVQQQFTQGNISATNNPLDIAINGAGFFRLSDNGSITYTRNGQFQMDKDGYLINTDNKRLTGYAADAAGNLLTGSMVELQINTADLQPKITGAVSGIVNLDSRKDPLPSAGFDPDDPTTFHDSRSLSVFDSLGNSHTLQTFFVKTAPGEWDLFTTVDGVTPATALTTMNFDGTGMSPTGGTATLNIPITNGATSPLAVAIDFSGSTQFGSNFSLNSFSQDGYTSGRLSGFNVGADGIIVGRYTNGQSANLGQLVMANFVNPNGLQALGGNAWAETATSGVPLVGPPNTSGLGVLQSSAVEDSNVDLTAELVNMITAQRVYQANAQTIKTQDQVLQTLVNLR
ncbi:MAG: flagellar hook protein FlgE [Betaproteobacteria bacterium HGW-Betaproteobacteria-2]|nr:MAG: flagellar hook protein FlgE [Betaproteobacteria bacterium HGW-Betaproteobacteria-2]